MRQQKLPGWLLSVLAGAVELPKHILVLQLLCIFQKQHCVCPHMPLDVNTCLQILIGTVEDQAPLCGLASLT